MKFLFSSHLSGKAENLYNNWKAEEKTSWPILVRYFQTYYQLIPRDGRTILFDLKMRLADFKQQANKKIADYLKRATSMIIEFPIEEFDIGMATMREINDKEYQS